MKSAQPKRQRTSENRIKRCSAKVPKSLQNKEPAFITMQLEQCTAQCRKEVEAGSGPLINKVSVQHVPLATLRPLQRSADQRVKSTSAQLC